MSSRVQGFELERLESALRHWRRVMVARDPGVGEYTLNYRHKAIVASAAMGLPDLCEEFAKPPHERSFP